MHTVITSRENEKIKLLCRLMKSRKTRLEYNLFVCEGAKLCNDISEYLPPKEIYFTQKALEQNPKLDNFQCEKYVIAQGVADKISDVKTTQGVFFVFDLPKNDIPKITQNSRIVILDKVQDPKNVGAIMRNAAAFGFDIVIMCDNTADCYCAKALRSGMSSTVKIPVMVVQNLADEINRLKNQGVSVVAAMLENSVCLTTSSTNGAIAVVIGNEGQGISYEVAEACTQAVRIPISNNIESLNAAVASGILMYHYRKI